MTLPSPDNNRAEASGISLTSDKLLSLSNQQLLEMILSRHEADDKSRELAENLLHQAGDLPTLFSYARTDRIMVEFSEIPLEQQNRVLCLLELGWRLLNGQPEPHPLIASAEDAVRLVRDMEQLHQETVRAILLDNNQRVTHIATIYIGTLNGSLLRVSEVFREAITRNSPAFILVHNHPSGDPTPSPEDIELTRTLTTAGELLDIQLIDHLIIGKGRWISLKTLGFMLK